MPKHVLVVTKRCFICGYQQELYGPEKEVVQVTVNLTSDDIYTCKVCHRMEIGLESRIQTIVEPEYEVPIL
jgi:hypothetical protein